MSRPDETNALPPREMSGEATLLPDEEVDAPAADARAPAGYAIEGELGRGGTTRTGAVMGTPSYMPPEQARGDRDLGPTADVYALGAILYECLSGRPPFRAATPMETLLQVLNQDPVPPRQLNAAIPADLETICAKCLRKEPTRRYASAEDLADDLGRFLAGEPIRARPVGAIERAAKWVRRYPAISSLTAATILALEAGVAVSGYFAYATGVEAREARRQKERADDQATEAKARRAEDARHAIQIDLALRARDAGDLDRLGALVADMRGEYHDAWEMGHLRQRWLWHGFPLRSFVGHTGKILSTAFSPDGRLVLTGSEDETARIWDAETGQEKVVLRGHAWEVRDVAWGPDGRRVVTVSRDKTARVWDAETGREPVTLQGHAGAVSRTAFGPAGRVVAWSRSDNTVRVWDAEPPRPR